MKEKRLIGLIIICFFGITLLVGRLAQIQLISTGSFSKHGVNLLEASVNQRVQEMVIDNGRGNFLDRLGEPLVYKKIPVLILFPFLKDLDWPVEKIANIIDVSEQQLNDAVQQSKMPFAFGQPRPLVLSAEEMTAINQLKIPGVFAVERKYPLTNTHADQLIGITGENPRILAERYGKDEYSQRTLIGLSGLEKSFDELLIGEGKSRLVFHVDGIGSPLFGIDVKLSEPANPFYPINVKTTVDKTLQEIAEELVDKHRIKDGGLVLLDIKSNDILAMVSRPHLNRNDPFGGSGIDNKMLKQQIPGSIFKTVTAAAAIDYELLSESRRFNCSETINGEPDMNYQHGVLNFTESFARSCNRTFADLAKELQAIDKEILEKYAHKLSLTEKVGWTGTVFHTEGFQQLADEEAGRVFVDDVTRMDQNYVALSAIGQHEVRVTPLAVANMMATIARGGDKRMVRAVDTVLYQNGTKVTSFKPKQLEGGRISPYTAQKLQNLLRQVVIHEEGTGRWFQDLPYSIAGKSGTAETGIHEEGRQKHNKWFAGYFPFENPKYALVVVNLGVPIDEGGVNPLFAEMVTAIYKNEIED
ncbi:penicillin-binding protein 2 [Bacillus sp. B15-48]|uniref:peptidoglycan D,D-transpeptidase FtsI family protein n=1 Tax=Bacillus sp. B15-48 TaxID=1548601 RepID=UPI00193EDD7E|nr:penicillin-binding protein 2 [Bacillus sp. B15-48]MBM4762376.1 penicillin-binding protein 2 [Bacillus sp. B15-48]